MLRVVLSCSLVIVVQHSRCTSCGVIKNKNNGFFANSGSNGPNVITTRFKSNGNQNVRGVISFIKNLNRQKRHVTELVVNGGLPGKSSTKKTFYANSSSVFGTVHNGFLVEGYRIKRYNDFSNQNTIENHPDNRFNNYRKENYNFKGFDSDNSNKINSRFNEVARSKISDINNSYDQNFMKQLEGSNGIAENTGKKISQNTLSTTSTINGAAYDKEQMMLRDANQKIIQNSEERQFTSDNRTLTIVNIVTKPSEVNGYNAGGLDSLTVGNNGYFIPNAKTLYSIPSWTSRRFHFGGSSVPGVTQKSNENSFQPKALQRRVGHPIVTTTIRLGNNFNNDSKNDIIADEESISKGVDGQAEMFARAGEAMSNISNTGKRISNDDPRTSVNNNHNFRKSELVKINNGPRTTVLGNGNIIVEGNVNFIHSANPRTRLQTMDETRTPHRSAILNKINVLGNIELEMLKRRRKAARKNNIQFIIHTVNNKGVVTGTAERVSFSLDGQNFDRSFNNCNQNTKKQSNSLLNYKDIDPEIGLRNDEEFIAISRPHLGMRKTHTCNGYNGYFGKNVGIYGKAYPNPTMNYKNAYNYSINNQRMKQNIPNLTPIILYRIHRIRKPFRMGQRDAYLSRNAYDKPRGNVVSLGLLRGKLERRFTRDGKYIQGCKNKMYLSGNAYNQLKSSAVSSDRLSDKVGAGFNRGGKYIQGCKNQIWTAFGDTFIRRF